MRAIAKRFPGVQALDGVDFDVRAGEVHALMGQNGAGKSTLIKLLTGVHPRDAGEVRFEGLPLIATSPSDAQAKGISTIYQEVNLIPTLSVAENLTLGRWPRRWYGIDWRSARRRARAVLSGFGLDIEVDRTLGGLPVAIRQMVAIARAVETDARLIVMDEPTSSLDAAETERLFGIMRRLTERGVGIVFVTHFLEQAFDIGDRITVLRNGRNVGTYESSGLSRLELVGHMLGKTADQAAASANQRHRTAAEASAAPLLSARGLGRRPAMAPFDIDIRKGEVLGLAGLLGSGRTETAHLLSGVDRSSCGTLTVGGRSVGRWGPRRAIALGVALSPEDRRTDGIVPEMSVRENIALVVQRRLSRVGVVSRGAQTRIAEAFVRQLGIDTPDLDRPVKNLSGGNQQKVILARWLACEPSILILDEPTRGIDVGAKVQIERIVDRLAAEGMAIVFISSELEEVIRRSDRVMVLRDRTFVGKLTGAAITERRIMRMIAGEGSEGSEKA